MKTVLIIHYGPIRQDTREVLDAKYPSGEWHQTLVTPGSISAIPSCNIYYALVLVGFVGLAAGVLKRMFLTHITAKSRHYC